VPTNTPVRGDRLAFGSPRDPKIGQVGVAILVAVLAARDEDIGRLDGSVHESTPVRRRERGRHGLEQLDRAFGRQRSGAVEQRPQVSAVPAGCHTRTASRLSDAYS
jgi:hypothetical protein